MFAYEPALLAIGDWGTIALATATATIGVMCLASSLYGYLLAPLAAWQRVALAAAAFLLIKPGIVTDAMGLGLLGAVAALLGACLLYPIFLTVRGGFAEQVATGHGFTLAHVGAVFRGPTLVAGLLNSACLAACTTAGATLIALPLAVLTAGYRFPLKGFFNAAVLVPMILPPFVGAIGMQALLGRYGAINSLLGTEFDVLGEAKFWGVVLVESLHLYPIIYLNATAALANLDPALDEAALTLGANRWQTLTRVTLPLIRPGVVAAALFSFVVSFSNLEISLFLVGPGRMTLPIAIMQYLEWKLDPTIAAVSVIQIAIVAAGMLITDRFVRLSQVV